MLDLEREGGKRIVGRVFSMHYPLDTNLLLAGFEIILLREPARLMVGGLEDGPASKADIHQGDIILSVNGTDPKGKLPEELEAMFSDPTPQ